MKKLFTVLLTVFTLVSMCTGISAHAENESKVITPPHSMLVLGDSISTGFRLYAYESGNNYNTQSYANLLASSLHLTQENSYKNLAIDGQTSEELLKKLKDGEYDENLNSDLICLTIGGNDLLGEFLDFLKESVGLELIDISNGFIDADFTNPELLAKLNELLGNIDQNISEFSNNFSEILSLIHTKNESAYIITQTVYNPLECLPIPETVKKIFDSKICRLNDSMTDCTEKQNGSFECVESIDIYRLFKGQSDEMTNMLDGDIHPNQSGHKKIYAAISDVISAHSFSAENQTESSSNEAKQVNGHLDNVEKSELKSVIFMCAFVAVFGIVLLTAIIVFIRKKKRNS